MMKDRGVLMRSDMNGKHCALNRWVSLLLVLAMTIVLMPVAFADAPIGYGYVNYDKVRFRKQMSSADSIYCMLDTGWVVEIYKSTSYGSMPYYYVKSNLPSNLEKECYGYIQQQYVTTMSAGEIAAWQAKGGNGGTNTPTPEPSVTNTPAPASNYATAAAGTNYYSYTGGSLISQGLLDTNKAYYIMATANIGGTQYYVVTIDSTNYYVKADCMTMQPNGGSSTATPTDSGSMTAKGTLAIKPSGNTNMRSSAAITTTNIIAKIPQNTVLSYFTQVQSGSHTWYLCYDAASNQYGYIIDYCVEILTSSVTPTPTAKPGDPGTVKGYVEITPTGKTNIRKTAATGTNNVLTQVTKGTVLPYYSSKTVDKQVWYYVYVAAINDYGWVIGTCAQTTSKSGTTPAPSTPVPEGTSYIVLTYDNVNLRKSTSTSSPVLGQYGKGTTMTLIDTTTVNGTQWYHVTYNSKTGYVMAKFAKVTSSSGDSESKSSGYLYTKVDKVYVRKSASGTAGTYGQVATANTVLKIVGPTTTNGGVKWYKVEFEGNTGYIHGGYVTVMSDAEAAEYEKSGIIVTPTPSPTPAPKPTNMIQTIVDKVYIRKAASTSAGYYGQAKLGAVFEYTEITAVGSKKWYTIKFEGITAYMLGSCVKVLTDAEYNAYLNSLPTPTPSPAPTPVPDPADMSNTALTNIEKVVLRSSAGGSQVSLIYVEGTVCTLLGSTATTTAKDGTMYTWYNVSVSGTKGWVRGDLLRILTKTEAAMYAKTGDPDAKPEASYVSLQYGSTGEAVTKLKTKLAELGYYTGPIDDTYDYATKNAVINYQKANGLTVDGIAGSKTQHSIYGTVETGYYDSGEGPTTTTLYTPELMDWYSSNIQSIFYKGCIAVVTDVKTGLSFKVKRWSGGNHADVEPLTANDTRVMCQIYGVAKAQDIYDNNLYQRRPVLVTVGKRSFCGSVFGFPHNYPEGDTIADNDFYGQFCIHFVNSKTHGGDSGVVKVDSDHQEAIQYAYKYAVEKLTAYGYTFK